MKLSADAVTVRYAHDDGASPKAALHQVSASLAPGQLVAVTGPNGSGKTTLLRAMLGLVKLDEGSVTLDQRPLAAWSRRAIAEQIAALPQLEEPAFPLTVRESMLLGRWARLGPLSSITEADEVSMEQALVRCDLAGFATRRLDTLSGGERQRARLARALAATPRLLLLDEPTAALDIGHEMELFELLRSLVADGLGVLIVTHQLNLAARYASRMLLLHQGRLVAEGTAADVLRAELLSDVFAWPIAVAPNQDGVPQLEPLARIHSSTPSRLPS